MAIKLESNIQLQLLYSIYKEWTFLNDGEDPEGIEDPDGFEWMVNVKPFASEESANKYIDRVNEWMLVDFPHPKFRYGESSHYKQWEIEIIGPFANASQAGEFVDNLMSNFRL
jgi:hypothetical protein